MSAHVNDKRYFVKVRGGKQQALAETIYYRNEMTFEFFIKWRWYFEYRAALYRVNNPRHFVDISHGGYEYIPPRVELIKMLKNKITNRKGKVTQWDCCISKAKETWSELFPIEDDQMFQKAVAKLNKAKLELEQMEAELENILNNENR
jgi:hypothetical protein